MTPQKPKRETGPRIGVFVCNCGINIAGFLDTKSVAEYASTLPNVVFVRENLFSCSEAGINDIRRGITENKLDRVVVAACTPRTHEPTFRRACRLGGLNPYLLEMVNLRNQNTWVHKDYREEAHVKALDMIRMGVDRARLLQPLEIHEAPVAQRALVIGGGIAGMTAAANLSQQGYATHLVEKEKELGGMLRKLGRLSPSGPDAADLIKEKKREVKEAGVNVHLGTEVEVITGFVGSFNARLTNGEELKAGAVVLAMGGNTGIQSSTLVVRRIALGEMKGRSVTLLLLREVAAGALMGIVCGLVIGIWAHFMITRGGASPLSPLHLAGVVGMALFSAMTFAAVFGAFVPLVLDRAKIDPAVASGPFITMANDNPSWGYTRIQGALKNIGYKVGRSTIRRILIENGIDTAPERSKRTSWPLGTLFDFFVI